MKLHKRKQASPMRRLTVNEWLTLLVSVGSLLVAYASYRNSADTRDIKDAVTGLADLARQTKRQADIQGGQLALLKGQRTALFRQADAAADSAKAARDTAETAKRQTGAIIKQADALIHSANATTMAAAAQLTAAQANTKTAEAGVKAAQEQFRTAELLAASRSPIAQLSSVELIGWLDTPSDGKVTVKLKPHFKNIGGGTLLPQITTFNAVISQYVPATPAQSPPKAFGGNSNPIPAGGDYYPVTPIMYAFSVADVESVKTDKKGILVWGRSDYRDTAGKVYALCYVASVQPPTAEEAGGAVRLIDAPAYDCPNGR